MAAAAHRRRAVRQLSGKVPLQCRNGGGAEGGLPLCGNGERRDAVPRRDRRVERRVRRGGDGADGRGARHGRAAARQRGRGGDLSARGAQRDIEGPRGSVRRDLGAARRGVRHGRIRGGERVEPVEGHRGLCAALRTDAVFHAGGRAVSARRGRRAPACAGGAGGRDRGVVPRQAVRRALRGDGGEPCEEAAPDGAERGVPRARRELPPC